jgi:hypothetical protein
LGAFSSSCYCCSAETEDPDVRCIDHAELLALYAFGLGYTCENSEESDTEKCHGKTTSKSVTEKQHQDLELGDISGPTS